MPKIVFYYIQKEAGSSLQNPDCFSLNKDQDVTIQDVIDAFPLSRFGEYHLRFRKSQGDSYQWIEPQQLNAPVPMYGGGIFLKVLNLDKLERMTSRIPIEESISIADDEEIPVDSETDTIEEFDFVSEGIREPEVSPIYEDFSFFPGESSVSKQFKPTNSPQVVNDEPDPLLTPISVNPVIVKEAPVDLKYVTRQDIRLDREASKLTATTYEGKSATVVAAMKQREKQLREKQIKALMEKKERDIASEVKEVEKGAAKDRFGKMLDAWAYDISGHKKNIRTLLTTMHSVMWDESNFTQISMAQLLAPEKVKVFYRKAMLKVHPDKCIGFRSDQIYVAQRIFDALNDAWSIFQDQENADASRFQVY